MSTTVSTPPTLTVDIEILRPASGGETWVCVYSDQPIVTGLPTITRMYPELSSQKLKAYRPSPVEREIARFSEMWVLAAA